MRKRGLTLTEVLTVLAVLTLSFFLLLPVVGAVRKQGRLSRCTAQLQQLGHAYSLYLHDYGRYPSPLQLAAAVPNRRLLYCPEDPSERQAASSYTFRAALAPDFRPYWGRAELDPNTVLLTCTHHLERPVRVQGETHEVGEPRYPFQLILRADGRVERLAHSRVREMLVPGDRPRYIRMYPGEEGYNDALR